ncbi:ferritin family protein [Candidatus Woesearchaeota archaeon]|nr:ferritin family protein [Candidatus Woesearchaeota archaeon]
MVVKKRVKKQGSKSKKSRISKSKKGSNKKRASPKKRLTKGSAVKKGKSAAKTKKTPSKKPSVTPRFKVSPDDKNILRFMLLAIDTEKKGIKFYTAAKRKVDDYNMTRLLDMIIEQEKQHLAFFKAVYAAEKKKGTAEAAKEAAKYKGQPRVESPLFKQLPPKKLQKKISTIHNIFKEALDFEVHGHDMYRYMARRVKNKKIKAFLSMVATEELKHRNFIHQHQDALYDTGFWLGLEHVRLET